VYYGGQGLDSDHEFAAIASMLQQVGIGATAIPLTVNDWEEALLSGRGMDHTKFGVMSLLENGRGGYDYPDPEDYMTNFLRGGEPLNAGYYDDPAYDQLVDRAGTLFKREKRSTLYPGAAHCSGAGFVYTYWTPVQRPGSQPPGPWHGFDVRCPTSKEQ